MTSLAASLKRFFVESRYAHFFLTGIAGVGINLFATWFFAEYVFGREQYFKGYLIGIVLNLAFNFFLHVRVTFRTQKHVVQRLLGFLAYSLGMTVFQAWIVKTLISLIGLQFYLFVIAGVILIFSVVTFVLFKFFLFRNTDDEGSRFPQLLLIAMFTSVALHVAGLMETLSVNGVDALLKGDATGYVDLARNLFTGNGFGRADDGPWMLETFRTPGLPLLLLPFMAHPLGVYVYIFLQTILSGIVLPLLVYLVGKRLFSPRAGMIGGWLIALEPQVMFSSWSPLTEIPFLVLCLLATYLVLKIQESQRTTCRLCNVYRAAIAGLLYGYAILVRPGLSIVVVLFLVLAVAYAYRWKRDIWYAKQLGIVTVICLLVLVPWQLRNLQQAGVFGLSSTGWWNVYVDYGASVAIMENGNEFYAERSLRRAKAQRELGAPSEDDLKSPAYSSGLRDMAVSELWEKRQSVLKLESLLLVSFFTNDNYYNQLIRNGFVPAVPDRISPTQTLLREGISGIPRILEEMRKQYFVPILSRCYQFLLLLLAGIGLLRTRPIAFRLILLSLITCVAVISTVIGFGMEVRLRMPIMPLLFLLVGHAFATGLIIRTPPRRMVDDETRDRRPGL